MDTPGLTQSNKRVSLPFKRCGSRGIAVLHYGRYANGFQFNFFSGSRVTFTG